MRKTKILTVLLFLFAGFLFANTSVLAEGQRLYDKSGLFDAEEAQEIEALITSAISAVEFDIVVVTTDNAEGKSPRDYADDFYDENGFGYGEDASGCLLLLDFENREVAISTAGKAIYYLTDERIERILDDVMKGMADADYHLAIGNYLKGVEYWVGQGIPEGQYTYDEETGEIVKYQKPKAKLPVRIAIGLLTSLVAGGIFYGINAFRYRRKVKVYKYPYRQKSSLRLMKREDRFINERVTSIHIPRNTSSGSSYGSRSSSGRSTTHRSSSGRSHGGGSRKF